MNRLIIRIDFNNDVEIQNSDIPRLCSAVQSVLHKDFVSSEDVVNIDILQEVKKIHHFY